MCTPRFSAYGMRYHSSLRSRAWAISRALHASARIGPNGSLCMGRSSEGLTTRANLLAMSLRLAQEPVPSTHEWSRETIRKPHERANLPTPECVDCSFHALG